MDDKVKKAVEEWLAMPQHVRIEAVASLDGLLTALERQALTIPAKQQIQRVRRVLALVKGLEGIDA